MKEYINFRSSGEAYDACNSRPEMATGRIFTVEAEKIVGISWAWPIAVTVETGFSGRRRGMPPKGAKTEL